MSVSLFGDDAKIFRHIKFINLSQDCCEYTQIHAYCHYRVVKAYSRNLKRPLNKDEGHSFWYYGTNMNDLEP